MQLIRFTKKLQKQISIFPIDSIFLTNDARIKLNISGSNKNETTAVLEFFLPSYSKFLNAIDAFKSYEGIRELFENSENAEYITMLNIDTNLLLKLKNREVIYKSLAEKTATIENINEQFNDVMDYFNMLCVMNTIAEKGYFENVEQLIENDPLILLSETGTYGIYTKGIYHTNYKANIFSDMKNSKGYKTLQEFYDAFDIAVILNSINDLLYWSETTNILKMASNYFNAIDFSGYSTLGDRGGEVDKAIAFHKYSSLSDLEKAYNKAVADVKNQYAEGGSRRSSGSGGGGFSAGFESRIDPINPIAGEENKTDKATKFNDVEWTFWAIKEIHALVEKNIIKGYEDNSFRPDVPITRSEFLKMLVVAMGINTDDVSDKEYNDVRKEDWYYPYVAAASQKGIVQGMNNNEFAPFEWITREAMASMVYRAMNSIGFEGTWENKNDFMDKNDISNWATDAVAAMNGLGIINGYTDGSFGPMKNATRAEAAVIVYRVIHRIQNLVEGTF